MPQKPLKFHYWTQEDPLATQVAWGVYRVFADWCVVCSRLHYHDDKTLFVNKTNPLLEMCVTEKPETSENKQPTHLQDFSFSLV